MPISWFNGSVLNPQGVAMKEKVPIDKDKVDPERMAVLRSLPVEVKQTITGEEAQAFLYNKPLPESLVEKLKDYIVLDD